MFPKPNNNDKNYDLVSLYIPSGIMKDRIL